jgi:hypothetical protein
MKNRSALFIRKNYNLEVLNDLNLSFVGFSPGNVG